MSRTREVVKAELERVTTEIVKAAKANDEAKLRKLRPEQKRLIAELNQAAN